MIRSLYVRIATTFLLVVLVSIALSFVLTSQLFKQHSRGELREHLSETIERIRQLYDVSAPDSLEPFLDEMALLQKVSIVAVNGRNEHIAAGEHGEDMLKGTTDDRMAIAVSGRAGPIAAVPAIPVQERLIGTPAIGRLVTQDGEEWTLFIRPNAAPQTSNFLVTVSTLIGSLLAIGSVLIVIAARYLVKPIKQINAAALRMAAGDFSVRVPVNRSDELGELAGSMNTMACGLSRIERMRQDFVANVSHEIQSPLTSINGFAEALRSDAATDEERRRYVGIIQQESVRLSKMSENLLKLSSLDSQHHPFHPKPYRLDRQLRQVALANEPAWLAKGLNVELYTEALEITADEDLLSQVWHNLLANSIKFTPPGGSIAIVLKASDGRAETHVLDTGIGIPEEERDRVFERFYKADPSRNRNAGGSGLGLAIAAKIVELHRGEIALAEPQGNAAWELALQQLQQAGNVAAAPAGPAVGPAAGPPPGPAAGPTAGSLAMAADVPAAVCPAANSSIDPPEACSFPEQPQLGAHFIVRLPLQSE